jgi:hypothetical protein
MNDAQRAVDCAMWACDNGIKLDGRTFTLQGHLYQLEPMQLDAPMQCSRKGAQIGWTSIKMLKSIHGLIYDRYPQGVLYLFPTRDDVTDFSKGRFQPLISDNPIIQEYVKDTDAANIKRVGKGMLYFRGARSTRTIGGFKKTSSQLKSVPADRIVFDEVDEMEKSMVELAEERLSHSSIQEIDYISTPTIPNYGIDVKWRQSDMRLWFITCTHCGARTCMEQEFEENGWERQKALLRVGGAVIRACRHCAREIYPHNGEWVISYPERTQDMVGWWISQLNSIYVKPEKILAAFEDPERGLTEAYNSKIGMPFIEAQNQLAVEEVYDCCGDMGIQQWDAGPCSMGVDQGKGLHVVIGKRAWGKAGVIVHINEYKEWGDLDGLMKKFHVSCCVVDGMPEMRAAQAFAGRFPGRVWLNFYDEHRRGPAVWNEQTMRVSRNRTECLDASHQEISAQIVALPRRSEQMETFARQCCNVAKRLVEDEETGSKRYIYVRLGADHYRHAFSYEGQARAFGANNIYAGCDLS